MRLIERLKLWWKQKASAAATSSPQSIRIEEEEAEDDELDPYNPFPEPVVIEFTDVLDLHYIPPKQVKAVVEEFVQTARQRGYRYIRIIHGKGVGVQREIVRGILARTTFVVDYSDAPPEAGGWGATIAVLNPDTNTAESGEPSVPS